MTQKPVHTKKLKENGGNLQEHGSRDMEIIFQLYSNFSLFSFLFPDAACKHAFIFSPFQPCLISETMSQENKLIKATPHENPKGIEHQD